MENILVEKSYNIPSLTNRTVNLGDIAHDGAYRVLVKITHPPGFEKEDPLTANTRSRKVSVFIPKRIGGQALSPMTVTLRIFQNVKSEPVNISEPEKILEPVPVKQALNPTPEPPKENKSFFRKVFAGSPIDFKSKALEEAQSRKEKLTKIRGEVNTASPLKPAGLDKKYILTADDCDYSRGMSLIENLKILQEKHNKQSGRSQQSEQKSLCEFVDVISFSGISVIIGLYVALGTKSKGKGNLDFLSNWYQNELSKIFLPTSFGNLKKGGKQIVNRMKPKAVRKSPNPGLSIKQAERIIGAFFSDEYTGEPLRVKDLQCEIYQPVFLDDEQTRVYSRQETPNAKLVDIVLDTGLDPLYFQNKKIEIGNKPGESAKLSLGPTRRSFDLPLAQHNTGIMLVSVGSELTYQESERNMEGLNPAQIAFLNKKKSHRLDWLDTEKYMKDHSGSVSYLRVEARHMYGVTANSIAINDLEACKQAAKESKWWSNGRKTAIEWG